MDGYTSETLMVRDTIIAKLDKIKLVQATMPLKRICALLDPRRKECSADHLVNGNSNLKSSANDDVNSFVEEKVGATFSAAKCGGDGGGGGSSGGSNPVQWRSKKRKALSNLEERMLARFAWSKTKVASKVASSGTAKRHTIIHRELQMYLAEDAHPEEDDFSLFAFWRRRKARCVRGARRSRSRSAVFSAHSSLLPRNRVYKLPVTEELLGTGLLDRQPA